MTIKRGDVAKHICEEFSDIPRARCNQVVDAVFEFIAHELSRGETVGMRKFGSFRAVYRRPSRGHHPVSGEPLRIPARYVPRFVPSQQLRDRIDRSLRRSSSRRRHPSPPKRA
jgi:nucleoid DNA-binding protein